MSAQRIRSDRDKFTIDIVQKTTMRLIATHRDDREACLLRIYVVWHAMAVEAGLSENDANELAELLIDYVRDYVEVIEESGGGTIGTG